MRALVDHGENVLLEEVLLAENERGIGVYVSWHKFI